MNNFSFVTVTFNKDFALLLRQINSIKKFFSKDIPEHYIFLNDDKKYLEEVKNLCQNYNCDITSCYELDNSHQNLLERGWNNQQIIKLLACSKIKSKFYVVLDSKDYFTSYFNFNYLIEKYQYPQRSKSFDMDVQFEKFFKNSYDFFELNSQSFKNFTTDSRTPVLFETEQVKKLIRYIQNYKDLKLCDIINPDTGAKSCTEFYLYTAWLEKNSIKIDWIESLFFPQVQFSYEGRLQ